LFFQAVVEAEIIVDNDIGTLSDLGQIQGSAWPFPATLGEAISPDQSDSAVAPGPMAASLSTFGQRRCANLRQRGERVRGDRQSTISPYPLSARTNRKGEDAATHQGNDVD
jgi:hypothetical protein